MRAKDHKNKAADLLATLSHWIKTSKFDYNPQDLEALLDEVKDRYTDYIELKKNPRHESKIEQKSYK
tara:strand:- start:212 stop:412 length:201 start_codon:yes stop_codon:yes gene_type:complete